MSPPVYRINAVLSTLLHKLPIGTNLALFHLLWTLLSGRLLASRGALFPALAATGLAQDAVRRAGAALAYGQWQIAPLVTAWERQLLAEGVWQPHAHDGYRPVAGDLVGFFRPRLQECPTKHYFSPAGKALPAIPLALAVRVGSILGQRVPVPCLLLRADPADPSEASLQRTLLQRVGPLLADDEVFIADGGFPLTQVRAAPVPRFVVRAPKNFTARRASLPTYSGCGRPPEYGEIVRPLSRQRKGKSIPATPPDHTQRWIEDDCILHAAFWYDLVPRDEKPGGAPFTCVVIWDPRYLEPLLLVTNLAARPTPNEEARYDTPQSGPEPAGRHVSGRCVRNLYRDRWPVEQLPLAAKQMLGAARQFVFGLESRQRLPELTLLAGAILIYEAASQPAIPTGFWDRRPQATSGRLRRVLGATSFSDWEVFGARIRKKASPTAHLPTGVLGHRRRKRPQVPPDDLRVAA